MNKFALFLIYALLSGLLLLTVLVHRSELFLGAFGTLILIVAGVVSIICRQVWLAIVAMRVRWWRALFVFFIPIIGEVSFAAAYWRKAKKPFLTGWIAFWIALCMSLIRSAIAGDLSSSLQIKTEARSSWLTNNSQVFAQTPH